MSATRRVIRTVAAKLCGQLHNIVHSLIYHPDPGCVICMHRGQKLTSTSHVGYFG